MAVTLDGSNGITTPQILNAGANGSGNIGSANAYFGTLFVTTLPNITTTGNLSVTGTTTLTGVPTAPTPAITTANTQIATTAFVRNILPTGVILMWSGSVASIPSGWLLCNGASGTPDLRDRFVVGAGSTYAVAATGGTADAVVVSHNHTATSTDSGHTHGFTASVTNSSTPTGPAGAGGTVSSSTTATGTAVITTTVATAGVSGTGQNLPPYYALAYIMKA
jgi:microcystin-dependent protein